MYLVPEHLARTLIDIGETIPLIESAFRAYDDGRSCVFAVAAGYGDGNTGTFGVKLGLDGGRKTPGLKIGSYWTDNQSRGLPNHGSTTVILDNDTGLPRAIIGASHLTALRTAGADAVAVKHLSRPEASILAIIGAGHQAFFDVAAIAQVRNLRQVRICARNHLSACSLIDRLRVIGLPAEAMPPDKALRNADIVVTVTSARTPVIEDIWVEPGTHISAMGSDAIGKQELPVSLVARSHCFCDVVDQSCRIGEFQHAHSAGVLSNENIPTLGGVITRRLAGRKSVEEVTIFDSSGIALQDLVIGNAVLDRAIASGAALDIAW